MKAILVFLMLAGFCFWSGEICAQKKAPVKKQSQVKSNIAEKPVPTGPIQIIECGWAPDSISDIVVDPDVMPVYKYGDIGGLVRFINQNRKPLKATTEGMVVASFVVDTMGQVNDVQIIKHLSDEANKEALRLTKLLVFEPGRKDDKKDKKVKVRYNLPIRFESK